MGGVTEEKNEGTEVVGDSLVIARRRRSAKSQRVDKSRMVSHSPVVNVYGGVPGIDASLGPFSAGSVL